jgi:hypothetical protein
MPWYQVFEGPSFIGRYAGQRPSAAACKALPKARKDYKLAYETVVLTVLTENTHRRADYEVVYDSAAPNAYGPPGHCTAKKVLQTNHRSKDIPSEPDPPEADAPEADVVEADAPKGPNNEAADGPNNAERSN